MSSGPSWEREYRAARNACGFYPVTGRVLTALTGEERSSFLHGMVVSDINNALEYSWTISAFLNPKGKMISDMALYHLRGAIWIETGRGLREMVETTLRRYALRAAIRFEDLSKNWAMLDIVGPDSGGQLGSVPEPGQVIELPLEGSTTFLARTDLPFRPSLRWLVPAELAQAAADRLQAGGAARLDPEASAALRMEAGIPIFGTDVTTDNLAPEVPLYQQGISYEKGCYIGQETVARLHARGGKTARNLRGILSDSSPAAGSPILAAGKQVGAITSTTWSPAAGRYLSLAMVHRSAMESGTKVEIGGSEQATSGTVTELPYQEG